MSDSRNDGKIKRIPTDLGTTIEMRPPVTCRTATPLECMAILKEIASELERIGEDPTASEGYNLACKDNARLVREWLGPAMSASDSRTRRAK